MAVATNKYNPALAVLQNLPAPAGSDDASAAPLDWRALAQVEPPARRWAITQWFGFGHITLLVGPGGTGKTLLAQQMASCIALGRRFIAEVPEAHRVLFWACEDDADELHRRELPIARSLEAPLETFAELLHIVPRAGMENTLVTAGYGGQLLFSPLLQRLQEQAFDLAADVVVLDNVAQMFGCNENDRHHVTASMNALLGALPHCAILLLAHPSRALGSEFSGSSAWEAVARTRLYLGPHLPDQKPANEDEADDNVRYLARRKANYSSKDWRRLTFREGVLIPDEQSAPGGVAAIVRQAAAERTVLEGLRRLRALKQDPTDTTGTERFLPKMLCDYKLNDGLPKAELTHAMRRLMVEGKLRRAVVGMYSNRTEKHGLLEAT